MSRQLELPLESRGEAPRVERSEEASSAANGDVHPGTRDLMALVLERQNLQAALKRVRKNKGSAGIDGMTVDASGNLWATGPGGVLILSPEGKHLGSILTGQATANATFGGDGSVLYLTADMDIIRVQTLTRGLAGPGR